MEEYLPRCRFAWMDESLNLEPFHSYICFFFCQLKIQTCFVFECENFIATPIDRLLFHSGFPISGATYTQDGYLLQKIAAANVGTMGFEVALLVRIYSGWGYVGDRLKSKNIEYEETGWYDGNVEAKTEAELKRDKFLYQSDVQPAVDRLKLVTLGAAGLFVASCVGLNAANSIKPTFQSYDPRVLEMVQKDDEFANRAAKASGGRPTYCDSRYYRAVAGGGQGC